MLVSVLCQVNVMCFVISIFILRTISLVALRRTHVSGKNIYIYGPGRSVSIAIDYGLDGLGSNPGGDEIFRLSRLVLGPTQPPVKWVPGLSRG